MDETRPGLVFWVNLRLGTFKDLIKRCHPWEQSWTKLNLILCFNEPQISHLISYIRGPPMFKCSCTGILQTTIWSLCQTEGQRPPWLTMWMLPNMEFILTMQWLVKALIENKGQLGLHSLGITPLILAATSKMTNSTPSNDSHSTKYAVFLLGQQLVKHSICNIESGIHKLEFTAYIYLTVYSGILQRSLQNVLKVGIVAWNW